MDDLTRELSTARDALAPQWNVERAAKLYAATRQRGRRRAVRNAAGASVLVMAAVATLALGLGREAETGANGSQLAAVQPAATDQSVGGHLLRLADGSRAELAGSHSDLEVIENTEQRVSVRLVAGRAHFEVVRNPGRSFVVEAVPYRVEVIGTSFDVEHSDHDVVVSVMRGKVRVYGPRGAEDLSAGTSKRFTAAAAVGPALPPVPAIHPELAEAPEEEPVVASDEQRVRPRARRASSGAQANWRSLTQSGQYDAAFALMQQGSAVENDPAALMDAADAARLSGHPESAVQYLERVVRVHAASPVAPLAAFTLGRVYLDKLGQPDKAAESFERARRLAPAGSLAQDALAREVEALSKGGNAQKAYVRAQEYLRAYPNGRRVRAVQLYGGIE